MTDSPVASRFVAAPDNWTRGGWAPAGIAIHMAEGGGTVSWLTRNDGNSSHYVVEYTGRVTQMVLESRAAGSINPATIRRTNDAGFTAFGEHVVYGRTAVAAAIGTTRGDDPNRSVIAVEIEGFAATGPNAAQRASLARLVNDIRRRRGTQPALAHRDFQSYKACPGQHIAWVDFGGHAAKVGYRQGQQPPPPPPQEEDVGFPQFAVPEVPTQAILKEDPQRPGNSVWMYANAECKPDGKEVSLAPIRPLTLVGFYGAELYIVAYEGTAPDPNSTSLTYFVRPTAIASTRPVPGVDAAVAAELEQVRTTLGATQQRLATIKAKVAASAADVADD